MVMMILAPKRVLMVLGITRVKRHSPRGQTTITFHSFFKVFDFFMGFLSTQRGQGSAGALRLLGPSIRGILPRITTNSEPGDLIVAGIQLFARVRCFAPLLEIIVQQLRVITEQSIEAAFHSAFIMVEFDLGT